MSEEQTRQDMEYLAGSLWHRGSNTQNERAAAEHIRDRFAELTPDTELDEFHSIETFHYLFAAYYGEFFVIAVIAIWFPWAALIYGTVVFMAYLAEFTGYRAVARLLPQFESQNVVVRMLCEKPRWLFVISAHYDTGKRSLLAYPRVLANMHRAHVVIVLCMVTVLVACAMQALGTFEMAPFPVDLVLCWSAVLWLLVAAGVLLHGETAGQYARGASDNASGVAALMALARRFQADPLEEADVWLAATGSHEGWMNGMRHLVASQRLDRDTTFFLNLDHLGQGRLRYTEGEGMLHVFRAGREMVEAAQAVAADHDATPLVSRNFPSDALIPLTRGYKAMSITATNDHDVQDRWRQHDDNLFNVDFPSVVKATDFAEATLRQLARNLA